MLRPERIGLALVVVLATACSGVSYRSDVAEHVTAIDRERLREHVHALDAIGPRPVSDAPATRATVDYIARPLRELGYEVHEETFELSWSSKLVAILRPADEPDAEPTEIELPVDLASSGPYAMQAQSARLRGEGWKVEGYSMRSADEEQVFAVSNLIATKRGTREPDRVVELSAHYDTVPFCPGADDNSSGVAALLEVARVVAEAPTRKTIRLCFFGAEEVGLRGSEEHLRAVRADADTHVEGLINLDSVGFTAQGPDSQRLPEDVPWFLSIPDEADFIVVAGNWSSGWLGNLFEGAIDAYAPELPYYSANRIGARFEDADRSDHANYWEAGLSAMFLTDTGEFRTSTYHRPDDTAEKLDYAFLEAIARATAAAALHWAELDGTTKDPHDPVSRETLRP